jgi:mono/diheme cytochrome c family protein
MKRFILGAVFALAIVAVGVYMLTREQPQAPSMGVTGEQSQVIRGEYLARVGDCYACHTLRGGAPYAGGLEMATPFGSLYTTNITPDPDTGIGKWTADDFWAALHDGKSKDGSFLYPAMPYTNYTKVTREDSDAMYAYFRTVKPARLANRPPALGFPYNQRQLMLGWRTLYFKPGVYQDNPKQSKEWNRGAYLVEGLGHCNACHSARNALGAVSADDQYAGGLIPVQNWYAPSLTSNRETGLGGWDIKEIVELLRTGVSTRGAVYGPMSAVVQHSLQETSLSDLTAMATYLKSIAQTGEPPEVPQVRTTVAQTDAMLAAGAKLYEKHCADCHQPKGEGVPRVYPPLANNQSIAMALPINAIRIVLNGGFPPSTEGNPRPYGMPPFAYDLNDDEVAAVVTFIRQSWGNRAPAVAPVEIARGRGVPID